MSISTQNQRPFHPRSRTRVLLASIGLLLLMLGATLVILNTLGIMLLPGAWSNALVVAFAMLGAIGTFGQWFLPFSSPRSGRTLPGSHIQGFTSATTTDRDLESFRRQVERALDRRVGKGALIVYTSDRQVAHGISLVPHLIWMRSPNTPDQLSETRKETVRRYRVNAGYICAAVCRNLDPEDYMTWSDENQPISVPVFANEATVVDWR